MNHMKKILYISIFFLSTAILHAQSYKTAFGVRVGTEFGFTVKQKVLKRTTIEAILHSSFRKEEFQLSVIAERHFPLVSRRLNVYTGAGFHKSWRYEGDSTSVNPAGLTAIIGAEISLGRFNISYDIKPIINFKGRPIFDAQTGISLRYIVFRDSWVKKMKKKLPKFKK